MNLLVDSTLIHYATPAIYAGFKASQHNPAILSTFDTFDKVKPDIYIADADLISNAVLKNIEERPDLKVCFVQKLQGEIVDHPNEKIISSRFGNIFPWLYDNGVADILTYKNAEFKTRYKADIVSFGDRLLNQLININLPKNVVFRIFAEQVINNKYFCGFIRPENKKHVYASARLNICTFDEIYNSMLCGCYPVVYSSDDQLLEELNTDHTRDLKDIYEEIVSSRTNFHACSMVLKNLGYEKEAKIITNKIGDAL
jgi:hypothetical protein